MSTEEKTNSGRVLRGTVVASKMTDTCTVAVERYVKHPKYKVHASHEEVLGTRCWEHRQVGDKVEIKGKPISSVSAMSS